MTEYTPAKTGEYINNSLHLARKYAQIFVRGHYLFREANSFSRAKLKENCELRGADNVQGQISTHIFKAKWRLLWLLSFKYFSQPCSNELEYLNGQKRCFLILLDQQVYLFFCHKSKLFPHLDINFNCKLDAY